MADGTQMRRTSHAVPAQQHRTIAGHPPRFFCTALSILLSTLLTCGLVVEAAANSYAASAIRPNPPTPRTATSAEFADSMRQLREVIVGAADFQLPVPASGGLSTVLWQRFNPPAQNWLTGHRGVDLLTVPGQWVYAPADGVVTFVGKVGGKPVVSVTHDNGLRSTFEPVIGTLSKGDLAGRGTIIGYVGTWPNGTASHCPTSPLGACVHWGVRRGSVYLDPLSLLGKAPPIVLLPL